MARSAKQFLRCAVCGQHAFRGQFLRGRLGHRLESLTKTQNEEGRIVWSRQPLTDDEFKLIADAVAKATELVEDYDGETADPIDALRELDTESARLLGEEWITEAVDELNRRTQIVEAALRQRRP